MKAIIPNMRILLGPLGITGAVSLAPLAPHPFGFWLALAAVLIGPGWGASRILFPRGVLTVPEELLVMILVSISVDTIAFAALNAFGILLTIPIITTVVLTSTYGSTAAAFIRDYGRSKRSSSLLRSDEPPWIEFVFGVLLSVVVLAGIAALLQ